jgi:CRP/FNR family cyclic AMP-dependent transcriptional regulator
VTAPTELLHRVSLFEDLDKRDLQKLSSLFKERTFPAGATVAEEGQTGIGFFVIADGKAKVTVEGEDRTTLGPGAYFGEIALILDTARRTATIVAETELHCYGLTAWDFRPFVETNASVAWNLVQALAKKLQAAEHGQP